MVGLLLYIMTWTVVEREDKNWIVNMSKPGTTNE